MNDWRIRLPRFISISPLGTTAKCKQKGKKNILYLRCCTNIKLRNHIYTLECAKCAHASLIWIHTHSAHRWPFLCVTVFAFLRRRSFFLNFFLVDSHCNTSPWRPRNLFHFILLFRLYPLSLFCGRRFQQLIHFRAGNDTFVVINRRKRFAYCNLPPLFSSCAMQLRANEWVWVQLFFSHYMDLYWK